MRDLVDLSQHLPDLLERAGIAPSGWDVRILSHEESGHTHSAVIELFAPMRDGLIVNARFRPFDPDGFRAEVEAREAASRQISGVAPVLRAELSDQVAIARRPPGRTLKSICAAGKKAHRADALRALGAWVSEFHSKSGAEPRAFRPVFTQNHIDKLAQAVRSGQAQVPQKQRFLSATDWLRENQPRGAQCRTVAATRQGYLTLENLFLDGDRIGCVFFQPPRMLPVGHDLGQLFLSLAACQAPQEAPASILGGVDLAPFFEGYKVTGPGDMTLSYLTKARLIEDWARIPKDQSARSDQQKEQLKAIQRLVPLWFG